VTRERKFSRKKALVVITIHFVDKFKVTMIRLYKQSRAFTFIYAKMTMCIPAGETTIHTYRNKIARLPNDSGVHMSFYHYQHRHHHNHAKQKPLQNQIPKKGNRHGGRKCELRGVFQSITPEHFWTMSRPQLRRH